MITNTTSLRKPFLTSLAGAAANSLVVTLVAVGLLFGASTARAETKLSTADETFLLAAAQGGMTEVKLGELAVQQGARDEVKDFGRMMVKDHTVINDDLKALALQKGLTLPDKLDAEHQGMVDKMAALSGASFDKAYIADMIKGHKAVLKAFKAESEETKDADIKSFTEKAIPVVTDHLMRIKALKN